MAGDRGETAATGLEPGDRFEVVADPSRERLGLPAALATATATPGGFGVDRLEVYERVRRP